MNKSLLKMTLSLLISFPLMANIKIITPKDDLPLELEAVISEIKLDDSSPKHQRAQEQLAVIDRGFQMMDSQDILFFVKSQVYKEIISNHPKSFVDEMSIDLQLIQTFSQRVDIEDFKNPLAQWLITALKADLERFRNNNQFLRALNQLERGVALNSNEQREYHKVELILPWIRMFALGSENQINQALEEMSLNIVERISLSVFQYLDLGSFDGFSPDTTTENLNFFTIIDYEQKQKKEEEDRIQSIVNRIIQNAEELPTPVNDWTPRDEDEGPSARAQIISPDPNYRPPETLPKPVDDWIEDL